MSKHVSALRRRLRRMSVGSAPEPWVRVTVATVGGLFGVGFGDQSAGLLVASWAGRSVFDVRTGEMLSRDRNDRVAEWMTPNNSAARAIAPLGEEYVEVCGLWGGGLSRWTSDGWSVQVVCPDWPDERVVLEPPGSSVLTDRSPAGCVQLAQPITELRAVGFSPDGSALVIATSSDLELFYRGPVES